MAGYLGSHAPSSYHPPSAPPPPYMQELPPAYDSLDQQQGAGATGISVPLQDPQVSLRSDLLSYNEVLNALTTSLEEDLPAHQETMSVLEANHYRVAGELEAWRNHLQTQINDMYKKYKEKLRQAQYSERVRLKSGHEGVKDVIKKSRLIRDTAKHLIRTGNHRDLVTMKENMKETMEKIDSYLVPSMRLSLKGTSAEGWCLRKPDIMPGSFSHLMGTLEVGSPNMLELPKKKKKANTDTQSSPSRESLSTESTQPSSTASSQENLAQGMESLRVGKKYMLLHTFNSKTYKDKARCHPMNFTLDWMGNIVVADKYNKNIKVFTERGQLVQEITSPYLNAPSGITMTPEGYIAVSDSQTQDIKVFTSTGELLFYFQRAISPAGITFNHKGELLVADTGHKGVLVYDVRDGTKPRAIWTSVKTPAFGTVQNIMQYTTAPGMVGTESMQYPHYIAVNQRDDIYISDRTSNSLHVLDKDGHPIKRFGEPHAVVRRFAEPYGVTVDSTGTVLVADYGNNVVTTIAADDQFLSPILSMQHDLKFPTCVVCAPDGKLLVSEYLSGLVKVFGTEEIVEEISNEVSSELPPSYDAVSSIASVSIAAASVPVATSMGSSTMGGHTGAAGYTTSYTQPYTRLDSHETTI